MVTNTETRLLSLRTVGWVAVAAMLAMALLAGAAPRSALATEDKVVLCHAAGQEGTLQYVTIEVAHSAAYGPAGHFDENGTPNAGHEHDYLGECTVEVEPTPTPTPEPTPTPTPTPTPEPTPTPTPEATPTPTPTPDGGVGGETGTPTVTLPPSDALGTSSPSSSTWQVGLIVLAGILAAVLVLTPSSASRRR